MEKEDTREKIDIDVLNKEIAETVKNIDRLRAEIDKIVEELSWYDLHWWNDKRTLKLMNQLKHIMLVRVVEELDYLKY